MNMFTELGYLNCGGSSRSHYVRVKGDIINHIRQSKSKAEREGQQQA